VIVGDLDRNDDPDLGELVAQQFLINLILVILTVVLFARQTEDRYKLNLNYSVFYVTLPFSPIILLFL